MKKSGVQVEGKDGDRGTGEEGIQGSILVKIFDQDICFQKLLIKIKTAI